MDCSLSIDDSLFKTSRTLRAWSYQMTSKQSIRPLIFSVFVFGEAVLLLLALRSADRSNTGTNESWLTDLSSATDSVRSTSVGFGHDVQLHEMRFKSGV